MPNDRHPYTEPRPGGPLPRCPRCQGELERIRRRPGDRLVSLLMPVRRYRCDAFGCRWEGTLRVRGDSGRAATPARRQR